MTPIRSFSPCGSVASANMPRTTLPRLSAFRQGGFNLPAVALIETAQFAKFAHRVAPEFVRACGVVDLVFLGFRRGERRCEARGQGISPQRRTRRKRQA